MAVGKFKRQGGRRLRPERLASAPSPEAAVHADHIRIPGGTLLTCEAPASWSLLRNTLPGAATPTTTTLLAALWPARHFIFDWRVLAAVAGLDVSSGAESHGIVGPAVGTFSNRHLTGTARSGNCSFRSRTRPGCRFRSWSGGST